MEHDPMLYEDAADIVEYVAPGPDANLPGKPLLDSKSPALGYARLRCSCSSNRTAEPTDDVDPRRGCDRRNHARRLMQQPTNEILDGD